MKTKSTYILKWLFTTLSLFLFLNEAKVFATSPSLDVKKLDWNGHEVVWVKNSNLPLYQISLYFADGALSDSPKRIGESTLLFDALFLGTNKMSQKQISEEIEFYGTKIGSDVTHEYSLLSYSGLLKDAEVMTKLVCHLWSESTFPKLELKKDLNRKRADLLNLITTPSKLAEKIFRNLSLQKTPYETSVSPTLSSLGSFTSKELKLKKDYFHSKVKKRIYIQGPEELTKLMPIFEKECGFTSELSQKAKEVRKTSFNRNNLEKEIYFIPIPNANQVQIRVGRYLNKEDIKNFELLGLMGHFLGGGFTSQLMQELRVKNGLTYSIAAFATPQREYGRSAITTSTKSETTVKSIELINSVLEKNSTSEGITEKAFTSAVNNLAGSYLFLYEDPSNFLSQLIYYDHIERSFEDLYNYPSKIRTLKKEELAAQIKKIFDPNIQTIVVLGPKGVEKDLKKIGKVTTYSYRKFL